MRWLVLVAMLALGCSRADRDAADEVMARVRATRDRACTCKDVACAEAIATKLASWRAAHEARLAHMSARPRAYQARLAKLEADIGVCTDRLRAAAAAEPVPALSTEPPPVPEPELAPVPGDIEPPPRIPTPAMAGLTEI